MKKSISMISLVLLLLTTLTTNAREFLQADPSTPMIVVEGNGGKDCKKPGCSVDTTPIPSYDPQDFSLHDLGEMVVIIPWEVACSYNQATDSCQNQVVPMALSCGTETTRNESFMGSCISNMPDWENPLGPCPMQGISARAQTFQCFPNPAKDS